MRSLLHKAWAHLRLHDYKWKQKLQIILPIIGFLLACDVVTKVLAQTYLTYGVKQNLIGSFIQVQLLNNSGIAFGTSLNLAAAITIGIILVIFCTCMVAYLNLLIICTGFAFILSGSLGNLINRIWNNGSVTDFLVWKLFPPESIFNLADTFIILGCVIIGIGLFWELIKASLQKHRENKAEDARIQLEQKA